MASQVQNIIPLFKSHYSIGKSVLTLEKAGTSTPTEPASIIDICKENNLKQMVLAEDSMTGFLEAHMNAKAANLQLIFGLRLTCCQDLSKKDDESLRRNHKIIVFVKRSEGYKRLIKISSKAATDGFYYEPRIDFQTLKSFWSNDDLLLGVPFYDSFLYNNLFSFSQCVPDFSFTQPTFFLESNDLWTDDYLTEKLLEYCKNNSFETCKAKSIYYKTRADFKTYMTFRCIANRETLERPNIDGMTSPEFCMTAYKEQVEKNI